jgi:hypothetical protein
LVVGSSPTTGSTWSNHAISSGFKGRGFGFHIEDLRCTTNQEDTAIAAADTLLLSVPNQLGVDYNAHVIDSILRAVAPALGWR